MNCGILRLAGALSLSISVQMQAFNRPPSVSAGPPVTIGSFDGAVLDGTVADDGLPSSPGMLSTRWSVQGGPGTVTFTNANAVQTSARFSAPGTYLLELAAGDGVLSASDTTLVTVVAASVIGVPAGQPSIQAGIDAAQDHDVILVAPGIYKENLILTGKTVTLASRFLTSGDPKFIDQTVIEGGGQTVINVDASVGPETKIQGFTIRNGTDGISAHADLYILDNRFTGNGDAIDYESGGGICRRNLFDNNSDDGIDLDNDCAVVIEDNVIRDNGDDGIEIRLHPYAGATLEIVIRGNVISGNLEDGIQLIDYAGLSERRFLIEHNVISGNALAGLGLMDGGNTVEDFRAASIPEPIDVFGNTFTGNDHGLSGGDNLICLDNLFVDSTTLAVKGVDGRSVAGFNLFWNNAKDIESSVLFPSSSHFADPLLDAELRLQPGSPAIDAGTPFFVWHSKKALNLRASDYNGARPDLGAHEVNRPPVVDAGPDQSLFLPASVVLDGTVFDDRFPDPPGAVTTGWSQVAGPGRAIFADPTAADTSASFAVPGTYVLRLSADDGRANASDDVSVAVF